MFDIIFNSDTSLRLQVETLKINEQDAREIRGSYFS